MKTKETRISSESLPPNISIDCTDSDECTETTRCDSDAPESATDSLNSLIEGESIENCREVKCTLADQCPVSCEDSSPKSERGKSICCNTVAQCVWGLLLLFISVGGYIFTPLDFMLKEKLNMRPGFPPYEWWADPPDEVKLRVYVFNVTNHERFMQGLDEKLNVDEIGPIVYLEKLLHYNIVFNENSTMTYTAKRFPIYLPDLNTVDLNATLIVPNLALLGISSYLHNANYFVIQGFRLIANSHASEVFVKKTVYEYLWDYRESILDTSKNLAPGLVPVNNMGMLARIYADFIDQVTVKIGQQWGDEEFFQINRFRGEPQLPGYDPNGAPRAGEDGLGSEMIVSPYTKKDVIFLMCSPLQLDGLRLLALKDDGHHHGVTQMTVDTLCPDRIFGSSEGVMYRQRLSKSDVVLYWRKTVCKLMPLYFDQELTVSSVPVYRYNLSESVYERLSNSTDCYDTEPTLPDGLSDASKCYFNFPMVVSYPHFYNGRPPKDKYVTGMKPNRNKHNSYIVVEPLTGTPFHSVARMQSNLRIHDLSRFGLPYHKFSDLVLPLFWAEYNQEGLPLHIRNTIYFMAVILSPVSYTILALTFLLGCYFISKHIYSYHLKSDFLNSFLHFKSKDNLSKNNIHCYEKENFLKVPS